LLQLFKRKGLRVERWHGQKPKKAEKKRFIPVGLPLGITMLSCD